MTPDYEYIAAAQREADRIAREADEPLDLPEAPRRSGELFWLAILVAGVLALLLWGSWANGGGW